MVKINLSVSKKCIIPPNISQISPRERTKYKQGKDEIQRQLNIEVNDIYDIPNCYVALEKSLTSENSSFKGIFTQEDIDEKWKSIVCNGSEIGNIVSKQQLGYTFAIDFLSKTETL